MENDMPLFQCNKCGCVDNTSSGLECYADFITDMYDWTGLEEFKGKSLCSACAPSKHSDGTETEYGQWHGEFKRDFLQKGMWFTNDDGNIENKETGQIDYKNHTLNAELKTKSEK